MKPLPRCDVPTIAPYAGRACRREARGQAVSRVVLGYRCPVAADHHDVAIERMARAGGQPLIDGGRGGLPGHTLGRHAGRDITTASRAGHIERIKSNRRDNHPTTKGLTG